MMRRGLNAGFGEPIAHELPSLIRLGVKAIRQDLTLAKIPLRDLIAEFDDCIIEPLWLINPNQIEQVPDGSAIELVNEPNLTGWSVDAYADAVRVCLPKARLHNLTMYVGGISNTGVREQQYLAGLLQRVPEITHVSVHRYPAKSMASYDGHSGFRTRADETKALLRLIGERPYIVTEFGYHTAKFKTGWWWFQRRRLSDQDVARCVMDEWNWWEAWGADAAYLYQLNDGPKDTALDRYGIRATTRGGGWKPVADTFLK